MLIRPMRFEDLDQVYEMERVLFPNPWPRSFFEGDLTRPHTVALVVAMNNNEIIGYALASCSGVEFHITNIAVDSKYQRQRIGTKLMNELENLAKTRGCTNVYLEVRTNNFVAIELYKKLEYEISYTRKQYYLDGDDAYVMHKNLS